MTGNAAGWSDGDFNHDGFFDQKDVLLLFMNEPSFSDNYRQGPYAAVSAGSHLTENDDQHFSINSKSRSKDIPTRTVFNTGQSHASLVDAALAVGLIDSSRDAETYPDGAFGR